jgi:hypothetical protein
MAVVTTKAPSIINLDGSPIVANTIGEGAPGDLRIANDSIAAANGDSIGSIYRLCRIPTTAKIKSVFVGTTGITVGAADIDIAFSDSLTDGTQQQFLNLASPIVQITGPADNKLFGSAQSLVAATIGVRKDLTFNNTFLYANQNMPIWAVLVALGCTQFVGDPGGFFDIVAKLTAVITTAGTVNGEVQFVEQ